MNIALRFAQTAEPFKVKEDSDFEFSDSKSYENRTWLTSLEIAVAGKNYEFSDVLMTITQERNIVTTPLQGRDGTIKEFISNGDYVITVDAGVMTKISVSDGEESEVDFITNSKEYPKAQLRKLAKMLLEKQAIAVQSDFLEVFGIKSVVVKSFNLTQETHSNRQGIQMQLLSDEPYEIKQVREDYVKVK